MLAVPAIFPARHLQDTVGQPVVGVRTSGLVTLARQVFAGIGLDIDKDFQAIYVDQAAQSPGLVQRGRRKACGVLVKGGPGLKRGPLRLPWRCYIPCYDAVDASADSLTDRQVRCLFPPPLDVPTLRGNLRRCTACGWPTRDWVERSRSAIRRAAPHTPTRFHKP